MSQHWKCPYCNQNATITEQNTSTRTHFFGEDNKDGALGLVTKIIVCPNKECREYEIRAALFPRISGNRQWIIKVDSMIKEWQLQPQSSAKPFPDYIPKAIINDYEEACSIKDLSPKASATLSRRCLQGIIRDFWKIKKDNLYQEINAIKDKVDPLVWQAIDAVRKIGNIGAHMEKDINCIIDVEPQEAEELTLLIEYLLEQWYINRHEKEKQLKRITAIAHKKNEDKKVKKKAAQYEVETNIS